MTTGKDLKYPQAKDNCIGARLTSKGSLCKCLDDIRAKYAQTGDKPSKTKGKLKKKLEESCFGKLFQSMQQITFCGGLVHHMLVRQVEGNSHKFMEFNFFGNSVVFSLKEFGLVTGLKLCPPSKAPPPYSTRLVDTYFDGNKKIKNSKLREVYLRLKRKELAEPNDLLKLSLIYLLEVGILGKESQVNIKLEHFSFVDDLDYFNQYPWGLESYNMLIASMHRALDMHQGSLNKSATYSLSGCPLAFQVWGYETLPELGNVLATNVDNTFPRILNWKGTKIFNEQSISQMFHDFIEDTHIVDLEPSNEEEEFYIANEYVPTTTHKRRRRHDTQTTGVNEAPTTETLVDYPNILHEDNAHSHDDAGPSYSSSDIEEVRRRLDSMEASYNSIQRTINQERQDSVNRHAEAMQKIECVSTDLRTFTSGFEEYKQESYHKFNELLELLKKGFQPSYGGTPTPMPMPMSDVNDRMPMSDDNDTMPMAERAK